MKKPKLHSGHMEVAVAQLIGWRQHTIVPNVSWGLGLRHEADLIVLDKSGRLTEIEIKISKSDLMADFKKMHDHYSILISRLVYAVPVELVECATLNIPPHCGLISVDWSTQRNRYVAHWVKKAKHNKNPKPDQKTVFKLLELGCMRIWSLKSKLNQRQSKLLKEAAG